MLDDLKRLKEHIDLMVNESKNVVIVPHMYIDFDAIGSALGLSLIVKKLRKDPIILVNDQGYTIDKGVQTILDQSRSTNRIYNKDKYSQLLTADDLYILTDVNKKELTCLKDEFENSNINDKTIIIDHHDEGKTTIDAKYKFIKPCVSSASEIVSKLLQMYEIKINPDVANYLLAGISLDTDKLRKNISADTMKVASFLLENGADMNKVSYWFTEDFKSDRRVQELINKTLIQEYRIAYILADDESEYSPQELAKAADYLLKFGVDASFAIGRINDKTVSISARSKERINVGCIMSELNGGGNQYSGATKIMDSTVDEVGQNLVKIIKPRYYIK